METTQKRGNLAITIGIMGAFFASMSLGSLQPCMNMMYQTWSDISPVLIGYMISLPSGTLILGTLLVGALLSARKVGYKTVAVWSTVVFIIGGILPTFFQSFGVALFSRGLLGLTMGFLCAVGNPLISAFFDGDKKAKVISLSVFISYGGAMIMQLLSGVLCDISFYYCFLTHLVAIIGLLAIIFGLKEPNGQELPLVKSEKGKVPGSVIYIGVMLAIGSLCLMPALFNYSVIAANYSDSVSLAATIQMVYTISQLVASLLFAVLLKIFKRALFGFGFLLSGIGCLLVGLSGNIGLPILFVGMGLAGAGFLIVSPAALYAIGIVSKPTMVAFCTSLMFGIMNLSGFFASPYVAAVGNITGDMLYGPIYVSVAVFVVIGLIALFKSPMPRTNQIDQTPPAA